MVPQARRGKSPFHLNFEQQKKRAKELCRAIRRADDDAIERFTNSHPKCGSLARREITETFQNLNDAQLVIARELGLPNWAKLKSHIAAMDDAGAAILDKETTPDADMKTLHIRCGSDLERTLPAAGFVGDFLEYSDPVCQGPVIDGPEFLTRRVTFLSSEYEELLVTGNQHQVRSPEDILSTLQTAEDRLATAAHDYDRVVLWFEHDSYDQLILIQILAFFASHQCPAVLELVGPDHFPGTERFRGLGQLPPEAIRILWVQRQPVTSAQLDLGLKSWTALCQPEPVLLEEIMRGHSASLPNLGRALERHLQEFPALHNGLSLTEDLCLQILRDGSRTAGQVFRELTLNREPMPWLGDMMFWHIVHSMGKAKIPVYEISSENAKESWPKRHLSLTSTGADVLAGRRDWRSLAPPTRWLGGVEINSDHLEWRWDREKSQLVQSVPVGKLHEV